MSLLGTAYERNGLIELAEKQYADATRASDFDAVVGLEYVAFPPLTPKLSRGMLGRTSPFWFDRNRKCPFPCLSL
jgi:hypothetical protein